MSTNLDQAIDLLTKTDAYELPFASNIIELLGREAELNGYMSSGAFMEACRDRPISTLLRALQAITSGTVNELIFTLTQVDRLDLRNATTMTSFSAPYLTAVTGLFDLRGCTNTKQFSLPELTTVPNSTLLFGTASSATSLDLRSLVTVGSLGASALNAATCPLLTTVRLDSFVPFDDTVLTFSGCALSVASVEQILRRCVLSGMTTGLIILSGGTSAGTASLSAQGQADVAALVGQLTINA